MNMALTNIKLNTESIFYVNFYSLENLREKISGLV